MPTWDTEHEYALVIDAASDEINEIFLETKKADPTAVLKQLGILGYVFCDSATAAMICKLRADTVKIIRKPPDIDPTP